MEITCSSIRVASCQCCSVVISSSYSLSTLLHEKLWVVQVVKNYPPFIKLECSLQCQKYPPLVPSLSQMNPINVITSCFFLTHVNLMFPCTPTSSVVDGSSVLPSPAVWACVCSSLRKRETHFHISTIAEIKLCPYIIISRRTQEGRSIKWIVKEILHLIYFTKSRCRLFDFTSKII
jgi:hypothetical protein